MKLPVVFILLAFSGTLLALKSYSSYQVLSTVPLDKDGLEQIVPLLNDSRFYFWSWPGLTRPALIMSPPQHLSELQEILKNLKPQIYIDDVETVFEKERTAIAAVKKIEPRHGLQRNVTFDRYMEFDEIQAYLDEVVAMYPDLASIETIGSSYEGRPLRVLTISKGGASRPGVFIDAGIHAAEWLGPPSALYAVQQLTEFAAQNQEMLDLADWHILAVANPDGYIFSWSDDRTWRKTRRPNEGSDCYGADPNRNFDIHWGEGGETDPCLWNYPGPYVYSEIESETIADYVNTKGQAGELSLYMAMHTYGQFLLYPYGYTNDLPSQEVITAAEEAAAAVTAVRGTDYLAGSIANTLYLAFGNSQDFAYDVAGVPFTYTWELPAGGSGGFDPPPSEIRPVVEETWQGFKVLVQHATRK